MRTNEEDNRTGKNHAGRRANQPVRLLTASSISGDKLYNRQGEKLGKIADVMLNISDGTIEYIVIAFGGRMGIGRRYFAIPFEKLTIDTARHAFVIDESREKFVNSAGFNKNHWPQSNSHWERSRLDGGFMGANTGSDH